MSSMFKWLPVDSKNEICYIDNIVFKKPKNAEIINQFCDACGIVISSTQDIQKAKISKCCSSCYDIYYLPNKEKWLNGWRPIINN